MKPDSTYRPGHLAILASAGSGKTTQLTLRYIRLLADARRQITPSRICAMTFTRKAAGEILERIVQTLCRGASDRTTAGKMAEESLPLPHLKPDDFLGLLRLFLDNIHRASIGTMDSFVVSVARAFPLELGIPIDFQVSEGDGALAKEVRQSILSGLLGASGFKQSGRKEFLEAFKRATFGHEEKAFGDLLEDMISSFHLHYRFCPDARRWGKDETLIWPGTGRPWKYHPANLDSHAEIAGKWIDDQFGKADGQYRKLLQSLRSIVDVLRAYDPATPWDGIFDGAVFGRLLDQLPDLAAGVLSIVYHSKKYDIPAGVAKALGRLVQNLVAVEIHRALERTQGMHDLLERYDRAYDEATRQSGRFSFTDIQYLLAFGDIAGTGPKIGRTAGEGDRLYIDYRMDCRLDHWLLDEFQDTSDLQWSIFDNLITELVQSYPAGDERSLFYVGDVKQAIYRWRGGNPDLFLTVRNRLNPPGQDVIRLESMTKTHRCSQPVIDAVNRVFSNLPADLLPSGAIAKWRQVWEKHETFNKDAPGYVALLEPPHSGENASGQEEARFKPVADLLNEVQPIRRRIKVGILVRTNDTGNELVNALRRDCPGMSFVHEGKAGIAQNELAQVLLALARLAAHPGDEFAWKHILMSPMAAALEERNIRRANIAPNLLREIESGGFQAFVNNWGGRLDGKCPLNDYGRECLARLENAAAEFDAAGSRNCNSFLRFIDDYEVHEEASHTSVRVMTIHQAKGLEFDMVILPELQHRSGMNMVRAGSPDLISAGPPSGPDWILRAPKRIIVEHDENLKEQLARADEDHCFDYLCLLYVAMTRARNALYLITSHQKKSETLRPSRFVKYQLAGDTEPEMTPNVRINGRDYVRLYPADPAGEKWYESVGPIRKDDRKPAPARPSAADYPGRASMRQVLTRSEPSKQETFERKGADLFDPEGRDVLDFGSAIHELFEKIEWLDERTDAGKIVGEWKPSASCDKKVHEDVCEQFQRALRSAGVRRALARPAGNVDLWREKSFEFVTRKNEWISGIFDRVAIERDKQGRPIRAIILDYKSNRVETDTQIRSTAEFYRKQMELYRQALAGILNLPCDRIGLQLLFTRAAKVYELAASEQEKTARDKREPYADESST